jgi:hypothetical protein
MKFIRQKKSIFTTLIFAVFGFGMSCAPTAQGKSFLNETVWITTGIFNYTAANNGNDDQGRIAFVSNRGGNSDIYVMRPDGSELVNLTNHPAVDVETDWGP